MEFVEINANRKPKLSGGRRGNPTLLPGRTQVNSSLVPVSQLPASAGALGNTFKDIYNERQANEAYRSGRTPVRAIAMIPDGAEGIPVKRGGKMSKLIPEHGHGATTQIGTNYKLSQFGGSMAHPIGNTASTLSPALSGMSVGAGRKKASKKGGIFIDENPFTGVRKSYGLTTLSKLKKKSGGKSLQDFENFLNENDNPIPPGVNPFDISALTKKSGGKLPLPKGKDLLKLVRYMAKAKANLHGMKSGAGWLQSGMKFLGKIGKELLDKHGDAILNKGKELLLEQINKKANEFVGAGLMDGGSHSNEVEKKLSTLVNHKVVSQLGDELLSGGGWFNNLINIVRKVGHDVAKPFEIVGVNPWDLGYDLGHDVIAPVLKKAIKGGKMEGERKIGGAAKKPSARGAIVSKIMKEKNLSLPMASKYVKEHGLY